MANIFTTAGGTLVRGLIAASSWYIGWGTGAGTSAAADTTLFTESAEARVAATLSNPGGANVEQFVATMTASAARTITNAGVLSASSGGTLLLHSDFTGIVLNSGDSIQFTFQLTVQ